MNAHRRHRLPKNLPTGTTTPLTDPNRRLLSASEARKHGHVTDPTPKTDALTAITQHQPADPKARK